MTRKDYALIANAILEAKLATPAYSRPDLDKARQHGIVATQNSIAATLARECPGFNTEIFHAACSPPTQVEDDPAVVKRAFELHGIQAKASDWRNFLPQARAELAPTKPKKEG